MNINFIERPVSKVDVEENRRKLIVLTPDLQTGSMQTHIHTFCTDTQTDIKNKITKRSQCSQWVFSFMLGHTDSYPGLHIASQVEGWVDEPGPCLRLFECTHMKMY